MEDLFKEEGVDIDLPGLFENVNDESDSLDDDSPTPTDDEELKKKNETVNKIENPMNDIFEDDEVTVEEKEESEKKEEEPVVKEKEVDLVTFLKEEGLIDIADDEQVPEDISSFISTKIAEKVQSKLKDSITSLSPYTKNLISYEINGGNPADFVKQNTVGSFYDISTERGQASFLYDYYKQRGLEDEEIETQLKSLKANNKLKDLAEKSYTKHLKAEEEKLANNEKELKEKQAAAKKKADEYKSAIENTITEGKPLGQIKIKKTDKQDYLQYINTPVKKENGQMATKLYSDLEEVIASPSQMLQLATILRNRDKDGNFDFSFIEKQIETKVTNKIKVKLENSSQTKPKSMEDKDGDLTFEEWAKTLK